MNTTLTIWHYKFIYLLTRSLYLLTLVSLRTLLKSVYDTDADIDINVSYLVYERQLLFFLENYLVAITQFFVL